MVDTTPEVACSSAESGASADKADVNMSSVQRRWADIEG
jgi:hypothetical protein